MYGLDYLLAGIVVRLCKEGLEGPKLLAAGLERSDGICQLGVGGAESVDLVGLGLTVKLHFCTRRVGLDVLELALEGEDLLLKPIIESLELPYSGNNCIGGARSRPVVMLTEIGGGRELVIDADGRQVRCDEIPQSVHCLRMRAEWGSHANKAPEKFTFCNFASGGGGGM